MRIKTMVLHLSWLIVSQAIAGICQAAGGGAINNHAVFFTSYDESKPAERVRAEVQMDRFVFDLSSVQGKYKILPVRLMNDSREKTVILSSAEDKIVARFENGNAPAIWDASRLSDVQLHSAKPDVVRSLTYPAQLEPKQARYVYIFIPESEFTRPIIGLDYTIKSLGITLQLRVPPPRAE